MLSHLHTIPPYMNLTNFLIGDKGELEHTQKNAISASIATLSNGSTRY